MSSSLGSDPIADLQRCPSCNNPMLETLGNRCPLCGYALDAHEVVSIDSTPFAKAESRSYWKMIWWVLTAGSHRLGHLARMRRSRASFRFEMLNLFIIGIAGMLIVLPAHGWHHIEDRGATYPDGYPQPEHSGWHLVGKAPPPAPVGTGEGKLVRLWWNPGLWTFSLVLNFGMVLLLGALVLSFVRMGSNFALPSPYRGEQRFTAAIHYCTAHIPILFIASFCYGSTLLWDLSQIFQWDLQWSKMIHHVPAYLIAGLGLYLLWFWLLRMAHTAPPESRARVSRYFGLWAPAKAILLLCGWMIGQHYAIPFLATLLGMNFK